MDYLNKKNIKVFGPNKFSSQLEGSKGFMKDLCKKYNIPTAKYGIFNQLKEAEDFIRKIPKPIVVKADGLAAGKGVLILQDLEEAKQELEEMLSNKKFGEASSTVVVEEF